jgi:hypothetical protein
MGSAIPQQPPPRLKEAGYGEDHRRGARLSGGLLQRMHREIDMIEGKALEGQDLQEAQCMIAVTNALDQFLGMDTSAAPAVLLPDVEVAKIQRLEHELSDELDEEVLLDAYRSAS